MGRPPFAPYVVADSLEVNPWLPADEPRARSLENRRAEQKGFNRYTGSGIYRSGNTISRIRYIADGDLAGDWGRVRQISCAIQPSRESTGLGYYGSIGYRGDLGPPDTPTAQKTALKRSVRADYFALPTTLNTDVKAASIRDLDNRTESIKKEK